MKVFDIYPIFLICRNEIIHKRKFFSKFFVFFYTFLLFFINLKFDFIPSLFKFHNIFWFFDFFIYPFFCFMSNVIKILIKLALLFFFTLGSGKSFKGIFIILKRAVSFNNFIALLTIDRGTFGGVFLFLHYRFSRSLSHRGLWLDNFRFLRPSHYLVSNMATQ